MTDEIKNTLIKTLAKDLILDLDDRVTAEALKAFEMIRDHSGLDIKRSRALEGQARFRMMEKGFQETCELHGGYLLENGIIPNSDLKVFQPFMRFENKGQGVILGLAAMPEPNALPVKNKSRLAGVSLNYNLIPRLDFDDKEPKIGDLFALFLIARDKKRGGRIEEIAVGVIGAEYESYVHYEPLNRFMSGYVDSPVEHPTNSQGSEKHIKSGIKLRGNPKKFIPPEQEQTLSSDIKGEE